MSDAQNKVEMWVLVEVFDNDPSTSIFTSLEVALSYCASMTWADEDEWVDFVEDARESDQGARMEWGDDYIVLIKSEVVA